MQKIWHEKKLFSYALFPLSLLYRLIISLRYFFYKIHIFKSQKFPVPIIIVGNITVGGTGKTPLVIAIIKELIKHGFRPGIITRGYGGKSKIWPQHVNKNSDPILVGDEAVLLAKNTKVPVIAGPNRCLSVAKLLKEFQCNVIVSDDGLQHYALSRDIEIAVMDQTRQLGNGFCLPAGPLREPKNRLKTVDFVVTNGGKDPYAMDFVIDTIVNLLDETKTLDLNNLSDKRIIAIAGIGNPNRFFDSLKSLNIIFEKKIFPDHYYFKKEDIDIKDADIILMTEKDAVKCHNIADSRHFVVRGQVMVDENFLNQLMKRVSEE